MSKQKNLVFDLGGVLFEHRECADNHQKLFSPITRGIELLDECYSKAIVNGHKLYVCSNWSMKYIDILEQDYPQIFKMFDGIVTPTVAQAKKPDTKIFHYLLTTYDLIPQNSIFLDDQLLNVEAARSVGMAGIYVDEFTQVKSELARFEVF